MERIRKKLGFGCMRLPMIGDEGHKQVDETAFCAMVDAFLADGFNYFDTAHGYLDGQSEIALQKCLTSRYPRDAYVLTDKLSGNFFTTADDVRPFFEKQLEILGVDYLDFYLMHAQNNKNYDHFKECRAYETAFALKAEGKIRHVGISFHDSAEMLERILTDYPAIEVVQLQFNYVDYDSPSVQAHACYEVCRKHGKPILVMEPVKGGRLAKLPEEAETILRGLGKATPASYAIRFAAGFDGILCVLSGMGDMAMLNDNMTTMHDFKPLGEDELKAIAGVCAIFRKQDLIPCTACSYCTSGCPASIPIPQLFACLNAAKTFSGWNPGYYSDIMTSAEGKGRASDCLTCGACEEICPQRLPIRDLLKKVADRFER